MHLMKYKLLFFVLSTLVILPGLFFLVTSGLKLGIDFTGGTLLEYKFQQPVTQQQLSAYGLVTSSGPNTYIIQTKPLNQNALNNLKTRIASDAGRFQVQREENVGPVIGNELKQKAVIALLLSSLAIVLYITWSFRRVPKPASSLRFGVAAIVAL